MPTTEYKKRITTEFINNVETVISKGLAKDYAEIVDKLEWDKGAMSNVINNRRNVPPDKAEKLKEVYKLSTNYREQLRDMKLNGVNEGIPIYEDAPFTLGNVESYRDNNVNKADFWITIPGLRNCNYGCRAVGDSMYPMIRSHALVVGEEVTDFSFIPKGDIYIIRGKNGIETIKYIQPHPTDKNKLLLVPLNEKASTDEIKLKDIIKLYKAKAVFNVL